MNIVILITAPNKKEAKAIAAKLLKKKLIACANIVEKIESMFWWQGKIDKAKESLLIIKSQKKQFSKIIKVAKSCHSYEVPEIIALPITAGYKPYLDWINDSIG